MVRVSGGIGLSASLSLLFHFALALNASAQIDVVIVNDQSGTRHDVAASNAFDGMSILDRGEISVVRSVPHDIAPGAPAPAFDKERSRAYCRKLVHAGLVKRGHCEPNYRYKASLTPNDPGYSNLYGLPQIGAPVAWDTASGSGIVVAVVDTGIDYNHADLSGQIAPGGYNFVSGTSDPYDDNEHGTHCSGTIAAAGNNGVGVIGVAYDSKILPLKALDSQGSGDLSDISLAINRAVSHGASVISMSFGGPDKSAVLETAIKAASDAGVLLVAAAGNESADNDTVTDYPANFNVTTMISVAATDSADQLADFSNYGATKVHLSAPGVNILSTKPGGGYQYMSGTSMATPHVAGVAALVKSANPTLPPSQIKDIILQTVDKLDSLNGLTITGGRVNVASAVGVAIGASPNPPQGGGGGGTQEEYVDVSRHIFNLRKINVVGDVYLADGTAVDGSVVNLQCAKKNGAATTTIGHGTSNADGHFSITARASTLRTTKSYVCQLAVDGSVSPKFRLQYRR